MQELYKCGTLVNLKNININGYITGICIRADNITYEISYFMNFTYCTHWFNIYEFEVVNDSKMSIGYKNE